MSEDFKYEVYYCTSYGDIKGILTINEFQMTFDPLHSIHSDKTTSRSLDFRVCLELQDIVEAFMMNLPNKYCDDDLLYEKTKEYNKDYFLEINISRIGDEAIENKYKERIQDMKLEKLALATIFFKIYDQNYKEELKNTEKYKIANEIQKKVNGVLNLHSNGQKTEPSPAKIQFLEQSSTKIPFFDILYENLFKISQKKAHKGYKSKPTIKNLKLFGVIQEDPKDSKTLKDFEDVPEYIPKLIEDSNILTSEHFLEILDYIPPVLKLRNWKLVYSNITHGISLNTLIYKCKDIGPNILVVKDFKGWVFGAYCTDSWERGQQFYGKGETFLFSFKDGKKINSFTWSGKNHDFQFTDSDGLALGAGRSNSGYRFGLYIKGDLLSGNSYCCETFENDILSDNHDFDVKFIEIWGCDAFIDI